MAETDSGGGGGDGGGTVVISEAPFWEIAPTWLRNIAPTLKAFGRNPVAFVLGIILSTLLNGLEVMSTALFNSIQFVFVGSSAGSTSGQFGIEDIFLVTAELVIGAGQPVGSAILAVASFPGNVAIELASDAGLLAPIILAAGAGFYLIVAASVIRLSIEVGADIIPGLGGVVD